MKQEVMTDIGNAVTQFRRLTPHFESFKEAAEKNWTGDKNHGIKFVESMSDRVLATSFGHSLVVRYRVVRSDASSWTGELSCFRVCFSLDDQYTEELIYIAYLDDLGNVRESIDSHSAVFNVDDQQYADIFGYQVVSSLLQSDAVEPLMFST